MLTTIKSGPRFSGIKVLHDPGSNSVEFNILPQDTLRGIEYNGQTSNSKRADHFSELYAGKCEIDKEKATKYLSELIAPAEYEKRVRGFRELDDSLGLKSTENNSKYYEKNLNGIGLNPNAYYKFFKAIINESTIPNKTKKEMYKILNSTAISILQITRSGKPEEIRDSSFYVSAEKKNQNGLLGWIAQLFQ